MQENINEYAKLKQNNFEEKEIEHFKELKSQGFIVNKSTDEYLKMIEKAKEIQQINLTDTLSYVIAPTLNCNYNCVLLHKINYVKTLKFLSNQ